MPCSARELLADHPTPDPRSSVLIRGKILPLSLPFRRAMSAIPAIPRPSACRWVISLEIASNLGLIGVDLGAGCIRSPCFSITRLPNYPFTQSPHPYSLCSPNSTQGHPRSPKHRQRVAKGLPVWLIASCQLLFANFQRPCASRRCHNIAYSHERINSELMP
jgi:hypothetical protein